MTTLIVVFVACFLAGPRVCSHVHGSGSSIWMKYSPVVPAMGSGQKEWLPMGYTGPTAVPVVNVDGTIADTPEVAPARAAHLAAIETARSNNPDMDDGEYNPQKYDDHAYGVTFQSKYNTNNLPSMARGHHVTDVTTVKAHDATNVKVAKAKIHPQVKTSTESVLAMWKTKKTTTRGYPHIVPTEQGKPYTGPLAMLQLLPTGYLADTLEVTAAKKKHLSVLAEAQAAEALWRAKYKPSQQ